MTKTFPEKPKNIEKALVDGDILAYRSAFATQDKTSSDTEEVIDELMEYVVGETIGFYSKGALKVYLTGTNNFRHEIAKTATYKGHRKKMEPPEHLPHAREYLQSEWGAVVVDGKEGWMFNPVKGTWVFSNEWDSLVFFYTQILTGDASDQIWGLHRIGPKKAEKILEGATTELELYERCLKAYRDHPDCQGEPLERVLENGRLLHLQRYEGQLWEPPT